MISGGIQSLAAAPYPWMQEITNKEVIVVK